MHCGSPSDLWWGEAELNKYMKDKPLMSKISFSPVSRGRKSDPDVSENPVTCFWSLVWCYFLKLTKLKIHRNKAKESWALRSPRNLKKYTCYSRLQRSIEIGSKNSKMSSWWAQNDQFPASSVSRKFLASWATLNNADSPSYPSPS